MTQEQTAIQEQNELIALFDCFRKIENHPEYGVAFTTHPTIDLACLSIDELKYHFSFDWLMQVVIKISKIENGRYGFTVDPWSIQIRDYSKSIEKILVNIVNDDKYPMIEMYYMAVVDFIRWHNSYISSTVNKEVL